MGRGLRFLALGLAVVVAACSSNTTAPPLGSSTPSEPSAAARPSTTSPTPRTATAAPSVASPSSSPAAANEWPFVRTSCPGASGQARLVVALGTSETAGYGIRPDEAYSPQEAYPAQYADILCKELGAPVELHSYFPSPLASGWSPLAWWNERVAGDASMRADLAAARIVLLWAMGSHDIGPAFEGGCSGDWPDPLKACFEAAAANIPAETDRLFTAISALISKGTSVLAAAPYGLPAVIELYGAEPYWKELKQIFDARVSVVPLARKHGFTLVDLEAAFNGPTLDAMPAPGLFQPDGIHPTAAGALAVAKEVAKADGLPA